MSIWEAGSDVFSVLRRPPIEKFDLVTGNEVLIVNLLKSKFWGFEAKQTVVTFNIL